MMCPLANKSHFKPHNQDYLESAGYEPSSAPRASTTAQEVCSGLTRVHFKYASVSAHTMALIRDTVSELQQEKRGLFGSWLFGGARNKPDEHIHHIHSDADAYDVW